VELPIDEENVARFTPEVWAKVGLARVIHPAKRSSVRKVFREFTTKEKPFSGNPSLQFEPDSCGKKKTTQLKNAPLCVYFFLGLFLLDLFRQKPWCILHSF
jgi:hypothetical protein